MDCFQKYALMALPKINLNHMLILFSNVYGWLFREWEGASKKPRRVLHLGMAIIVAATLIITYGNYRGQELQSEPATGSTAATQETL